MKKSIIPVFVFLLCINVCEASNINLNTLTWTTGEGTAVYDFSISEARFDSQPLWEPGKQPVPLGIDKALQIAQGWIGKQSWSKQFEDFNEITLKNQERCWYYDIDFKLNEDDTLKPRSVIVLLDGSVVEPKLKSHIDSN